MFAPRRFSSLKDHVVERQIDILVRPNRHPERTVVGFVPRVSYRAIFDGNIDRLPVSIDIQREISRAVNAVIIQIKRERLIADGVLSVRCRNIFEQSNRFAVFDRTESPGKRAVRFPNLAVCAGDARHLIALHDKHAVRVFLNNSASSQILGHVA